MPFLITIFISSFLLFQVQPIIAKISLPYFGGGAALSAVAKTINSPRRSAMAGQQSSQTAVLREQLASHRARAWGFNFRL